MNKIFVLSIFAIFSVRADFVQEYSRSWMQETITPASCYKKLRIKDLKRAMRDIGHYATWYEISNNQVIIKDNSQNLRIFRHRRDSFTTMLQDLAKHVRLPDVQFIAEFGDLFTDKISVDMPIFSYSRKVSQNSFLVPDSEFTKWARDQQRAERIGSAAPFESKIPKLVWRGTTTGDDWTTRTIANSARYKLVKIGLENSNIIDAYFNNCCQRDRALEQLLRSGGFIKGWMSVEDQAKYRYQILVDGNSATWCRTYWQLFSGALIFKQKSDWILPVHYGIKPGVHYVEVQNDLSDLLEKLQWAIDSPNEARAIAQNALDFAKDNVTYNNLLAYVYLSLQEYKNCW
jgi:hypothetical protein